MPGSSLKYSLSGHQPQTRSIGLAHIVELLHRCTFCAITRNWIFRTVFLDKNISSITRDRDMKVMPAHKLGACSQRRSSLRTDLHRITELTASNNAMKLTMSSNDTTGANLQK
jgi:hypothetical protein